MKKYLIAGLVALLLFGLLGFILTKNKALKVKKVTPIEKTLEKTVNVTGFVDNKNALRLAFSTTGTISNILVKEGDTVNKGQILAYLNSNSLYNKTQALNKVIDQIALEKKIYIETYQNNLEGAGGRERYELNLKEYDKKIEKARLDFLSAQNDLTNYSITSPINAKVLKVYKSVGELATAGEEVLLLQGTDTLYFNALIDEEDLGYINKEDKANITLDALPNDPMPAYITYIANFVNRTTKTAEVHLAFENVTNKISYGMSGEAEIKVDEFKTNNALRFDQVFTDDSNNSYVWILEGNKLKKYPVEIIYEGNLYVAIKQNLKDKTVVVPIDTKRPLKEGEKAKIVNE